MRSKTGLTSFLVKAHHVQLKEPWMVLWRGGKGGKQSAQATSSRSDQQVTTAETSREDVHETVHHTEIVVHESWPDGGSIRSLRTGAVLLDGLSIALHYSLLNQGLKEIGSVLQYGLVMSDDLHRDAPYTTQLCHSQVRHWSESKRRARQAFNCTNENQCSPIAHISRSVAPFNTIVQYRAELLVS